MPRSDEGYNILCEKPYSCDATIKDLSDEQLKLILHNIQNCATEKDFAAVIEKHGDKISSLGFSRIYLSTLNEKDDIVFGLFRQYYVFRVHAVIDQFFSGMDYCRCWCTCKEASPCVCILLQLQKLILLPFSSSRHCARFFSPLRAQMQEQQRSKQSTVGEHTYRIEKKIQVSPPSKMY